MKRDDFSRSTGKSETKRMVSAIDTVNEASFKLRAIACPSWSDTKESSIARAARTLGLSFSQARRIIYQEVKCIPAHVLENIRSAYIAFEAKTERIADEQAKIAIALRREIEGRINAAPDDTARGETEPQSKQARHGSKASVGKG